MVCRPFAWGHPEVIECIWMYMVYQHRISNPFKSHMVDVFHLKWFLTNRLTPSRLDHVFIFSSPRLTDNSEEDQRALLEGT